MSGPFDFLRSEWPELYEATAKATTAAYSDSRTACFYARRAVELAVNWAYTNDRSLGVPYSDNIQSLIYEPRFKAMAGEAVFLKARLIIKLGNEGRAPGAAHPGHGRSHRGPRAVSFRVLVRAPLRARSQA